MTARILDPGSDWRNEPLLCPVCGWKGVFDDGLKDMDDYVRDCSCPECEESPMLAVVSGCLSVSDFKTTREMLSPAERAFGDAQVAVIEGRTKAHYLTLVDFPDLEGEALDLVWDTEGWDVVIRHGDQEIAREPGGFENYHRFLEMLEILRKRYGTRMRRLLPTDSSMLDLLGDEISALSLIREEQTRIEALWESTHLNGQA